MMEQVEALVTSYDAGRLSRRQLLQALALFVARGAAQAPGAGLMQGRMLHHVNVRVSDVARSEAFYRRMFGFPATRRVQGPDNHGFDLAGGGLLILQRSEQPGRIDHFCIGVGDFDADRLRAAVKGAGIQGVVGTASDNFFVTDPDGLRVQVSATDWPG